MQGDPITHLEDDTSHELRVRLLTGQELSDHFVHDVLGREEVGQEGWKDAGNHPRLVRETLPDPAQNNSLSTTDSVVYAVFVT